MAKSSAWVVQVGSTFYGYGDIAWKGDYWAVQHNRFWDPELSKAQMFPTKKEARRHARHCNLVPKYSKSLEFRKVVLG